MSNASKLITVIIILFLLGLFLPYLGINIFTEPPYSKKNVNTRRNMSSHEFSIPTNAHIKKKNLLKNTRDEKKSDRQKATINQQKSFDEIIADINEE